MNKENTTPTSETVFQHLELLFNVAVKQKNLNVALKSTELLGKQLGLFVKKPVVGFQKRVPFSFKNVSDEELGIMIKDLEEDIAEKEAKNQQQKRYQ